MFWYIRPPEMIAIICIFTTLPKPQTLKVGFVEMTVVYNS